MLAVAAFAAPAEHTSPMPFAAPKHQPLGVQSWRDRKAQYVADRPSPARVYGRRWQKLRAAYLAANPLCECGCGWPAQVVHHKRAHHGDTGLLLAWDNLQALTKRCHDRITAASGGGFGNRVRRA
jgi:5-methylcytosine-specific restriction protein A